MTKTFADAWAIANTAPGWYGRGEAEAIYEAACAVPKGQMIVEVGTYQGRSTVVLAASGRQVWTVDPEGDEAQHAGLQRHLAGMPRVRHHRSTCLGVPDPPEPIGLLHIDGCHKQPWPARDFERFEPFLALGSRVAFHDYANSMDVRGTVDHLVDACKLRIVARVGSLCVCDYIGNVPGARLKGERRMHDVQKIEEFLRLPNVHTDWIDKFVAPSALGNKPTLYATAALTLHILRKKVPGCLVECGVFAGAHPAIMAYICRFTGQVRTVYLCDSFEGIPKAGPKDHDIARLVGRVDANPDGSVPIVSSQISACPIENVRQNMVNKWGADPVTLRWVKGWFQDRIPKTNTGPIAMLRLDADLYESTKVCMEHLFPKVSVGGFVVVDDWPQQGVQDAISEVLKRKPNVVTIPQKNIGPVFWQVV